MPLNRGQSQTTRWYQLCFVPTSSDSSDDSDAESVVITPTTTSSAWQELSPPPSPPPPPPPPQPNPETQIDWRFPPPPPPPDFARPLLLQQHHHQHELDGVWAIFNVELQQDRPQSAGISHVFEGDKSGCSTIYMNGLSRVRVSEMDKLFLCPICMDEFKVCDQAYRLPCTHTYCSECILRWLNSSKTCPVCRLQLSGYSFDENNNSNMNSQVEFLSPSLSPPSPTPSIIHDDSPQRSEYLLESSLYLTAGVENSASGNSDEADYDSACDDLGDSQEDGSSHTPSDTLI